ncbi:MAG: Hsp70 family protein, partial [candidate division WOR-3 bacterium]
RKIARENRLLGEFELSGIPPAPRGVPQIEVTFDIDVNGILTVSAVEKATGKKADIKIHARTGLTEEEIQRMIKEAQEKEEEDRRRAELIELKNQVDAYIYSVEKSLKEFSSQISDDEKRSVEEKINKAKESLKTDNKEEIQKAYEELQNVWNSITTRIYQSYKSERPDDKKDDFRVEN